MILRGYQETAVCSVRAAFASGLRRILLVAPTGAGKTVMGASIISRICDKHGEDRAGLVLVLAHREEMLTQMADKLSRYDVESIGVLARGHKYEDLTKAVQLASVPALLNRAKKGPLPFRVKAVILDEAHHVSAPTYRKALALFEGAYVVGLTATPFRSDRFGVGDFFERAVISRTISELIEDGFLVPYHFYSSDPLDLSAFTNPDGSLVRGTVAAFAERPSLVGDVVSNWLEHASGRRTILFAANINHSKAVAEAFCAAGVPAIHIDGSTPKKIRRKALEDLASGALLVLCNVQLLTEGVDVPSVSCVQLARKVGSLGLYWQMLGRGLRSFGQKEDCLFLDHGGNLLRHGGIDDWTRETLDKTREAKPSVQADAPCFNCGAKTHPSHKSCPSCGIVFSLPAPAQQILFDESQDLRLMNPEDLKRHRKQTWQMLAKYAATNGRSVRWAWDQFELRIGDKTNRSDTFACPFKIDWQMIDGRYQPTGWKAKEKSPAGSQA